MKTNGIIAVACAALTLAGCATSGDAGGGGNSLSNLIPGGKSQADWMPNVDMKNVDQTKYTSDLTDCRTLAAAAPNANEGKTVKGDAIKGGLAGAAAIGVLAVATGGLALLPLAAGAAATTGVAGAAAGAGVGAVTADAKYKSSVNQCLTGRGYKIIG